MALILNKTIKDIKQKENSKHPVRAAVGTVPSGAGSDNCD